MDIEIFQKSVREVLKRERKRRRFSRSALASAVLKMASPGAKFSHMTIANIEKARTGEPGIWTLAKIIDGLGLRPSEFFAMVESETGDGGVNSAGPIVVKSPSEDAHGRSIHQSPDTESRFIDLLEDISVRIQSFVGDARERHSRSSQPLPSPGSGQSGESKSGSGMVSKVPDLKPRVKSRAR